MNHNIIARATANYGYFPQIPVILPFDTGEHIQKTVDALPEEYQNQIRIALVKLHNAHALSMANQDMKYQRRIG